MLVDRWIFVVGCCLAAMGERGRLMEVFSDFNEIAGLADFEFAWSTHLMLWPSIAADGEEADDAPGNDEAKQSRKICWP
ncbi:hypothetical protein ACLOJK_014716 [Asimina triloba]